jgi:hypothetical protein
LNFFLPVNSCIHLFGFGETQLRVLSVPGLLHLCTFGLWISFIEKHINVVLYDTLFVALDFMFVLLIVFKKKKKILLLKKE